MSPTLTTDNRLLHPASANLPLCALDDSATDPLRSLTAELATTWAAAPSRWEHRVEHVEHERWYLPLTTDDHASVWLISWAPGSGIDLHDHGDSAGALVVVAGSLQERFTTRGSSQRMRRRELRGGQLVTFTADHVHEVWNATDRPAVSIHAYAPTLDAMSFYESTRGSEPRWLERRDIATDRSGRPRLGTLAHTGPAGKRPSLGWVQGW